MSTTGTGNSTTPLTALRLTERQGVARNCEPVTSGIPLPESLGVTDPLRLRVLDATGREIPLQVRVTSRWGELLDNSAPLRWVLLDFNADVAAHATSVYQLALAAEPAPPCAGLRIVTGAKDFEIDTGAAVFEFNTERFTLFERVRVGGHAIVRPSTANGFVVTGLDGAVYSTAFDRPREFRVEEPGPLRAVVLVRGGFRDEQSRPWMGGNTSPEWRSEPVTPEHEKTYNWGLEVLDPAKQRPEHDRRWWNYRLDTEPAKMLRALSYTARITLRAGSRCADVSFTLENEGDSVRFLIGHMSVALNDVAFASLEARLSVDVGAASSAEIEGARVDPQKGRAELTQSHASIDASNERRNFSFQVEQNDVVLRAGERASGWAHAGGASATVALSRQSFWQDFPQSLALDGSLLIAGLWPAYRRPDEWGESVHVFAHGWHKTHGLRFAFGGADFSSAAAEAAARSFAAPLFAVADPPSWYADSGAWGLLAAAGVDASDPLLSEAIGRYEQERRTLIDPGEAADGLSLSELRETQGNCYGWQYYGTFLKEHDARCSACHYDWGGSAWLHFLRTGDERFSDEARILTRHHADLDQYHVTNDPWHNGMQAWEGVGSHYPGKRPFHAAAIRDDGPYHHVLGAAQCYTHTWSGSFALSYLLTGDPRMLEGLERTLAGGRTWWWERMKLGGDTPVPCDQTRSQGWCILHFLNLYRITGDPQLIKDAWRLFDHSLLQTEWQRSGCFAMSDGRTIQTFFIYPIEPLVDLHYWATRAGIDTGELTAFLRRWCDYARDKFYAPPRTTSDGRYFPWRNDYGIPLDGKADPDRAYCLRFHTMSCSAFAYLGWLLRTTDPAAGADYTRIARELFRDHYLYSPTQLFMEDKGVGEIDRYGLPIKGQRPAPFDPQYRYPIRFRYCIPDQLEKEQGWSMRGSQAFLWTLRQEQP